LINFLVQSEGQRKNSKLKGETSGGIDIILGNQAAGMIGKFGLSQARQTQVLLKINKGKGNKKLAAGLPEKGLGRTGRVQISIKKMDHGSSFIKPGGNDKALHFAPTG
jgi:hypothetical protein